MTDVRVALAIVINFAELRILVRRRVDTGHLDGYSEFPGGKIEIGETPREAAVRECFEETGVVARPLMELPQVFHTYPEKSVELHPVVCELMHAQQTLNWCDISVPFAELSACDFPPANESIVQAVLRLDVHHLSRL